MTSLPKRKKEDTSHWESRTLFPPQEPISKSPIDAYAPRAPQEGFIKTGGAPVEKSTEALLADLTPDEVTRGERLLAGNLSKKLEGGINNPAWRAHSDMDVADFAKLPTEKYSDLWNLKAYCNQLSKQSGMSPEPGMKLAEYVQIAENKIAVTRYAQGWMEVAKRGVGSAEGNPRWSEVGKLSPSEVVSPKMPVSKMDSVSRDAYDKMGKMIWKAYEVGFHAKPGETSAQLLERVAWNLADPEAFVSRSEWISKRIEDLLPPPRFLTSLNGGRTVDALYAGKLTNPTGEDAAALNAWKSAFEAMEKKSGVVHESGEDLHQYATRAIRAMLEKDPLMNRKLILPDQAILEARQALKAAGAQK